MPRGRDAADYFLFEMKRGKCDLFATALALMARAEGIPTRMATGFLEGIYDGTGDAYLLRECDRHAWVEAYLPSEGGWVTVDPTPGVDDTSPLSGWRMLLLRARFLQQDQAPGALVALLAAALALILLRVRRRRAASGVAADDPRSRISRAYQRFLSLLRRRGLPRHPAQTPLEYLAAVREAAGSERSPIPSPSALSPAAALTEVFVTARYGPGPVTEDHAMKAAAALQEFTEALRGRRDR